MFHKLTLKLLHQKACFLNLLTGAKIIRHSPSNESENMFKTFNFQYLSLQQYNLYFLVTRGWKY